jgi:hypothetical protein
MHTLVTQCAVVSIFRIHYKRSRSSKVEGIARARDTQDVEAIDVLKDGVGRSRLPFPTIGSRS